MNGWTNYETWNVSLWIQNDEGLYRLGRSLRNRRNPFSDFVSVVVSNFEMMETPDGVRWDDSEIDVDSINKMMEEL
jgi:hypothetical protein